MNASSSPTAWQIVPICTPLPERPDLQAQSEVYISLARATETLNNIKSNYTQNGMKYGLGNTERKTGNVRGHITYKEVPEED